MLRGGLGEPRTLLTQLVDRVPLVTIKHRRPSPSNFSQRTQNRMMLLAINTTTSFLSPLRCGSIVIKFRCLSAVKYRPTTTFSHPCTRRFHTRFKIPSQTRRHSTLRTMTKYYIALGGFLCQVVMFGTDPRYDWWGVPRLLVDVILLVLPRFPRSGVRRFSLVGWGTITQLWNPPLHGVLIQTPEYPSRSQ